MDRTERKAGIGMKKNIFLIGFMGTGKTTVTKELAQLGEFQELDMDAEIEGRENKAVSEIFAENGEEYFRNLETELIKECEAKSGFVIACGGGVVLRQENVESMKKSGCIFWLTADPKTVYERVRTGKSRPLLTGHMNIKYISALMELRDGCYQAAADVTVSTDGRDPRDVAAEILEIVKKM